MGVGFNTIPQNTSSGHSVKIERQAAPRRRFQLLAAFRTQTQAFELLQFAMARHGAAHSFRVKDWLDYSTAEDGHSPPSATDQILGIGDGVRTSWPMVRTYDPFGPAPVVRRITLPVAGTFSAAVSGTPVSATISNPGGVVVYASPPGVGAVVQAGCEFDVPGSFTAGMDSWTSLRADAFDTWSMDQLEIEEDLNDTAYPELWNPGGCKDHGVVTQSFAISYAEGLLHRVIPNAAISIFLPLPILGGDRQFIIAVTSGSGSVQMRTDSGAAIGSPISPAALKKLYCSMKDDGTFEWLLGAG